MGIRYDGGEPGSRDYTFDAKKANKFIDATIPLSGSALGQSRAGTVAMSGASPQVAGPLTYNTLYQFVSKNACRVVSSTSNSSTDFNTYAEAKQYGYWPADIPAFHIPVSGSSEYVLVYNEDGSVVEATLSIVERPEGD